MIPKSHESIETINIDHQLQKPIKNKNTTIFFLKGGKDSSFTITSNIFDKLDQQIAIFWANQFLYKSRVILCAPFNTEKKICIALLCGQHRKALKILWISPIFIYFLTKYLQLGNKNNKKSNKTCKSVEKLLSWLYQPYDFSETSSETWNQIKTNKTKSSGRRLATVISECLKM